MSGRGWLVVGCAALVFGLAGFLAGVLVGRGGRGAGVPGLPNPLAPFSARADVYAKVAAHPFWKVKVTAAQVEALAVAVAKEKRGTLVFIDDAFQVEMARDTDSPEARGMREDSVWHFKPDKMGKRCFCFDLYKYAATPAPETVAVDLLGQVEARHYKD